VTNFLIAETNAIKTLIARRYSKKFTKVVVKVA